MAGVPRALAVPLLLAVSLTLLTAAWLMGNPPSAAPDESANYVKALGAGAGDLAGEAPPAGLRAQTLRLQARATVQQGESREMAVKAADWRWRTTRTFEVPADLLSTRFGCRQHRPEFSWACLDLAAPAPVAVPRQPSYVGSYQPFVYVPSGALARLGDDPQTGMRLGRAGMAAIALALLLLAGSVLWDPRAPGLSLLGLIAAVTPMAIFLSATVSASGPEVAAAICFAAALARLLRSEPQPARAWAALAIAGAVLAVSRQLGPVFLALAVFGAVLALGRGRLLLRGRAAAISWSVVGLASALGLWWNLAYQPTPAGGAADAVRQLPWAVGELRAILKQEVGVFGALDSPLPAPAYVLWLALLGALLWFALRVSARPARLRLAAIAAGAVAATVVIAALHRQTGFVLQGRYVMPLFVLVPIYGGELLRRGSDRLPAAMASRLVAGTAAAAGAVQVAAWYANGRNVAVGTNGSWLFPFDAQWEPPLGWPLWTAVVLVAGAGYVLAGVAAAQRNAAVADPARREAVPAELHLVAD